MIRATKKKAVAAASFIVCVCVLAYQLSDLILLIQDLITRWIESASSWARDKPHAGEQITTVVRDNLKKSALASQITSAAVSSDCNQVSRLTSGTALAPSCFDQSSFND